jgi:hypothetical protein
MNGYWCPKCGKSECSVAFDRLWVECTCLSCKQVTRAQLKQKPDDLLDCLTLEFEKYPDSEDSTKSHWFCEIDRNRPQGGSVSEETLERAITAALDMARMIRKEREKFGSVLTF